MSGPRKLRFDPLKTMNPVKPEPGATCQEASFGIFSADGVRVGVGDCGRPAKYIVKTRDPKPYPMCMGCAMVNRMAVIMREIRVTFQRDGQALVSGFIVGRVGQPDPSARTPLWTFKAIDGKTAEPKRRRNMLAHDILLAYLRITDTKAEHVKMVY